MWDPAQYLRFGDERSRPFFELTARIAAEAPSAVVDLGCGPGTLTAALARRWPGAEVRGIDSSAEMIEAARALPAQPRLRFDLGDVREWEPEGPVDVHPAAMAVDQFARFAELVAGAGVHVAGLQAHDGGAGGAGSQHVPQRPEVDGALLEMRITVRTAP